MLIQEILPLLDGATEVVEVGDGSLAELLRTPEGVTHRRFDPDAPAKLGASTVVTAFVGPDLEKQVDAEAVAAALKLLPVGGRAVLLLGWPIEELPYHVLLGPLVDADCQVLQVAPLEKAVRHGAHAVVIAARVERLAPLRTHLDETPVAVTGEELTLRALLRLSAEYLFGDIVTRPARRNLVEFRDRNVAQAQRIRELEAQLKTAAPAEKQLVATQRELARVKASAAYQVGTAMVQGARKPGSAIVSVPVGLVRVWRRRGARGTVNGTPGATG